jgi:hypothetical protein
MTGALSCVWRVFFFFLLFFVFAFFSKKTHHSRLGISDGLWTKPSKYTFPPVLKLVLPMLTRGMASSPRDAEEVWSLFVRSMLVR